MINDPRLYKPKIIVMENITEKKVSEWFDKFGPANDQMVNDRISNLKSILNRIAKLHMPLELLEVVVDQEELDEVEVYAVLALPYGNRIVIDTEGHRILVSFLSEEMLYPLLKFNCYTEDMALDKVRFLIVGTLEKIVK